MTDPSRRAAVRIADLRAKDQIACNLADVDRMAEIIRAECFPIVGAEKIKSSFADQRLIGRLRLEAAAMQARAEHLESVLAKVREECQSYSTDPMGVHRDRIVRILGSGADPEPPKPRAVKPSKKHGGGI